ncbi:metallophosphoesterase family protein [Aureibaculum conchae]|uniref:metallophosphoesterase family protein n=1 Tax=Aureibaculum sp. 2308TA14-22 TaxID=3108392 RepID=UPI0033951A86
MLSPRKFVIGDIHGHYDELMELFDRVKFQFNNDILVSLGDLVDRGPKPLDVIEKLMQVKNFTHILGNHDEWCYQYLKNSQTPIAWTSQGGAITMNAYKENPELKEKHIEFFEKARLYFIDTDSRLFVHGGYNPRIPFQQQKNNKETLIWDRSLISTAMEYEQTNLSFNEFTEIFVGHTPTQFIGQSTPTKISNLWMLDTGIHQSGKLTIMNVETKEYWQSTSKDNSININKQHG